MSEPNTFRSWPLLLAPGRVLKSCRRNALWRLERTWATCAASAVHGFRAPAKLVFMCLNKKVNSDCVRSLYRHIHGCSLEILNDIEVHQETSGVGLRF